MIHASENVPRLAQGTQVKVMPLVGSPYTKIKLRERRMLTGEIGTIRQLHEDPLYAIVHRYTVSVQGADRIMPFWEVAPV
jgi:hypothetical protein